MRGVRGITEPITARRRNGKAERVAGVNGVKSVMRGKRCLNGTGTEITLFGDQLFRSLRCGKDADDIDRILEAEDLSQTVFVAVKLISVGKRKIVGRKFDEHEVRISSQKIMLAAAKPEIRSRTADRRHDLRDLGFGITLAQVRRQSCAPRGAVPLRRAGALGDRAAEITYI